MSLGLSVEDATGRAVELLSSLRVGDPVLRWSEELPDVLHAVCRELDAGRAPLFCSRGQVNRLYELTLGLQWPSALFEERSQILASLCYAGWNAARMGNRYAEMRAFEDRCEMHVGDQAAVRDFFALPLGQRSATLSERFLSDPSVLLTCVLRLSRLVNVVPADCLAEGRHVLEWIGNESRISDGERGWLSCQAVLAISGGLRLTGQLNEALKTLDWAETRYCASSTPLVSARFEYLRLTMLYDRREFPELLERVTRLLPRLQKLGLDTEVAKGSLLRACALKGLRSPLAKDSFARVLEMPAIRRDPLLLGISMMHMGNLLFTEGDWPEAARLCEGAIPLLATTGVNWALADVYAVLAEAWRNQGYLDAAEGALRLAVQACERQGAAFRASYLRILLAETLIANGQEREAVVELIATLPLLERESFTSEGLAATILLRQVLARSRADLETVHALRTELDRVRARGLA